MRFHWNTQISKENFKIVDTEDAAFAGGKQLDVAPTSVKGISKRYDVSEFENRAVGVAVGRFAYGTAHRLSADIR